MSAKICGDCKSPLRTGEERFHGLCEECYCWHWKTHQERSHAGAPGIVKPRMKVGISRDPYQSSQRRERGVK